MNLVQICNVGTITGGTGACAKTITQALPDWNHMLLTFGRVSGEMREHILPHSIQQVSRVTHKLLRELEPDFVIFHNTRRDRVEDACLQWPAIYYRHSNGSEWNGIKTVACSRWLADQHKSHERCEVLYQAVPRPARSSQRATFGRELTIGRLCTPVKRKWPKELIPFYAELAEQHRQARWEFVGCPVSLRSGLQEAVQGRAVFHEAGWNARTHFWNWDVSLYHHPTLTESFGRTAAEAMRTGCVPVVDDRGGFQEQIVEQSGFLCGTIDQFSDALAQLADPAERMRRSRRCRAHADEMFSVGALRERLLQLFRQTASKKLVFGQE